MVFIYKGYGLFYPPSTIGVEVFLLFAFLFIQFARLFIGGVGIDVKQVIMIFCKFGLLGLPRKLKTLFYNFEAELIKTSWYSTNVCWFSTNAI